MTNPANAPEKRVTEATRVPMSVPTMKLAVPDITGFFLHWFTGTKVPRALKAGYSFVEDDEVTVENKGVADDLGLTGSTDLGSRISVLGGGVSLLGEPERLYLMKLPEAWHRKDLEAKEAINERTARALRAGIVGAENDPDKGRRYMKAGQDLFFPKARKG